MAINAAHLQFAIFPSTSMLNGEAATDIDNQRTEPLYDGYETDPPSHYPKAGHGLGRTLPPEAEDLPWLVEDNSEVFSRIRYPSEEQVWGRSPTTL
jgi:hypothetical protein